jgi:hypothetical protein
LTKKDYIKIAAAFKAERPGDNWDPNKRVQWELDIKAITGVLAGDNSRFDTDRFLLACGLKEKD